MKSMAYCGRKTEIVEHVSNNLVSIFLIKYVKYGQWVVAVLASCMCNGCGLNVRLEDPLVAGMFILQCSYSVNYINTGSGAFITYVVIMHNGFKIWFRCEQTILLQVLTL
jgi:hypothetical protein